MVDSYFTQKVNVNPLEGLLLQKTCIKEDDEND